LDIRNFLAFQYEKRQAYELLASSLKWPVFTCPQVAGFARPLTRHPIVEAVPRRFYGLEAHPTDMELSYAGARAVYKSAGLPAVPGSGARGAGRTPYS
jgi:hypothetical protein